jgi:DNA-binding SARP family transcriptional activator
MDFGILGPLEALEEGRAVPLGGGKQRALLAVLLLHANETLSADRVIDELWGEHPPATAAKALQVHVSNLRKALGGDGVVVTRERGYELPLDPEQLDARRFERLVATGRGALAGSRPDDAVAALEEALSLWRGPPLADLAYEAFAQPEITRLEELQAAAGELLVEAKLALGRHAEVIERLERLVDAHPYREGLRAQLMLALYRCDRQADALQAYQDARGRLVDDLGIEPGERLRELESAILAQDPGLRLAAPAPAAPEPPRGPFVGREAELAELGAALDDALAGHGRVVLVGGEAGIGKSRIGDELMARARERGAAVYVGRAWEAGGAPAYWPWIQALRSMVAESDPAAVRDWTARAGPELATLLPELGDAPADTGPDSPDARFRLFESIASFLRAAAAARPVGLFLDDLHVADASSVLLLRFVAEEITRGPLLVLGCYRATELSIALAEALPEMTRLTTVQRISLKGLDADDTARLLELATGDAPSADLVTKVQAETDGNPLFAGEVARLLAAEGRLDAERLGVPEGVSEAIGRRLACLSDGCRRVLALASVIGREFTVETTGLVSGLEQEALFASLEEAMEAGLVGEVPGGGTMLRFSHMLVRDAVYEAIPATRRPGLHAAVGEALERRYGAAHDEHVAELAHHYLRAGAAGAEKAVRYAAAAGRRSAAQLAYEESARHYRTALDALGGGGPEQTCDVLLALGEALSRAGAAGEAKQAFARAADIAEQEGWADRLAEAALGYAGRFGWERASTDKALVPLLRRALALAGETQSVARVRLLGRLASALRDDRTREPRTAIAAEAMQVARALGDRVAIAYGLAGFLTAIEGPGYDARDGLAVAQELITAGEEIGDRELVFLGYDFTLNSRCQLADRAGVDVTVDAMTALAGELRQPAQLWSAGTARTRVALMEGRFADAERLIDETLAVGRRTASWNAEVSVRVQMFVLRREQGRLAEVEQTILRAVHEYPTLFRFRCAAAHLQAELGRDREARALIAELAASDLANEYVDAEWFFSMVLLADPFASHGDEAARQKLLALLAPHDDLYAQAPVEATFGSVARAAGVLAASLGRLDEAERHFDAALAVERRMRARPWIAHTQHDLARMLVERGDPGDAERAAELLAEATASYRELGMEAWAAKTTSLHLA